MKETRQMNRRDALKRMGMAIAAAGVMPLSACCPEKKRVILYFTGTGNSLYVARQLADAQTEVLSIPQLMRQERFTFEAEEIGLVYPIYGHMPPNMVRRFLEKAQLKADYKFAVLTFGNRKCDAVEILDRTARKSGIVFDYITTIMLVDNWLPNFDMAEQMKIDKKIPEHLAEIRADLQQRKQGLQPVTEQERAHHRNFISWTGIDPEVGFLLKSEQMFTVTKDCIDCGICTYVCPQGNYALTKQGVTTQGDCECCFACIQNCPQHAIQFAKTDNPLFANGELNPNARYRNEHVSLMDLKRANNQLL